MEPIVRRPAQVALEPRSAVVMEHVTTVPPAQEFVLARMDISIAIAQKFAQVVPVLRNVAGTGHVMTELVARGLAHAT